MNESDKAVKVPFLAPIRSAAGPDEIKIMVCVRVCVCVTACLNWENVCRPVGDNPSELQVREGLRSSEIEYGNVSLVNFFKNSIFLFFHRILGGKKQHFLGKIGPKLDRHATYLNSIAQKS